jgi:hypothetical protein
MCSLTQSTCPRTLTFRQLSFPCNIWCWRISSLRIWSGIRSRVMARAVRSSRLHCATLLASVRMTIELVDLSCSLLFAVLRTVERDAGPLFTLLRSKYAISLARDASLNAVSRLMLVIALSHMNCLPCSSIWIVLENSILASRELDPCLTCST